MQAQEQVRTWWALLSIVLSSPLTYSPRVELILCDLVILFFSTASYWLSVLESNNKHLLALQAIASFKDKLMTLIYSKSIHPINCMYFTVLLMIHLFNQRHPHCMIFPMIIIPFPSQAPSQWYCPLRSQLQRRVMSKTI